MSKIKRLAPKTCPDCGSGGTLFIDDDRKLTCRLCGYKDRRGDASPTKTEDSGVDPRTKWKVTYGTPNTPEVDRWAEVKYTSGLDYARQGKFDEALRAFEQAIDQQRDFIDAHLWIALHDGEQILFINHVCPAIGHCLCQTNTKTGIS